MNSPQSLTRASWIVPLVFGLFSMAQGADANWDLRNYHLYNAFAFLTGRLSTDLAPAGMQSYFNPLLDVPYYLMTMHLPAMLVGFIMGVVHGLNFVLLLGICRLTLDDLPETAKYRTPFWLAIAGCLTANFLSGVGNSMGDDTTSLFSLGALLVLLKVWPRLPQASVRVLATVCMAGIVSGAGAGLKLTTAVFCVAMCAGLLAAPLSLRRRVLTAFLFGVGVLAGLALTGGFWFVELWHRYGNPLYPQFSAVFPSPLTSSVSIVDTVWFPRNVWESLAWPFIFSLDPRRVGQARLHQVIWALAYACFWCWVGARAVRRFKGMQSPALPSRGRYVIAYVAIGYIVWMKVFSIQRYLVSIELCLPLVIYLMLRQMTTYERANTLAKRTFIACSVLVLAGGAHSWGHERWAAKMFSIDLPSLPAAGKTTVILTAGDPPLGWLVPLFPGSVAFATIRSAFPQARPAYDERIHTMARSRGGPVYALIPGYMDKREYDAARNARELADSQNALADYGFALDVGSCKLYDARIGAGVYPYQWCRVAEAR
ncbi:hypothetical protein P9239_07920 [Caballeronia sp. LZ062]|uniref:hypothetical protein n=1 Tax=unclassified Caballeronia TaxID=2646786 RepID=UPI00286144E4|nr:MULTISPECIES: hypothetical protein [unclassified Caballeronia]MDR5855188.1 hypothetical protein [Caballeronia sp. LZ050]MDR5870282.1 hypothetical protein [Caballeronia sp. LZ062]